MEGMYKEVTGLTGVSSLYNPINRCRMSQANACYKRSSSASRGPRCSVPMALWLFEWLKWSVEVGPLLLLLSSSLLFCRRGKHL